MVVKNSENTIIASGKCFGKNERNTRSFVLANKNQVKKNRNF